MTCLSRGFLYYYLATAIVVLAVVVGYDLIQPSKHPVAKSGNILQAFANWDGEWYLKITTNGYSYDPDKPSNVAFFPAYPMLARVLSQVTGLDPILSLLIVSHVSLIAAFALVIAYARVRYANNSRELGEYVLLSLGLFPTSFFFRMAYTESLFVFLTILCLYGMERRWPLLILALLVGLVTAARPVGVAILPPFALYLWHVSVSRRQFWVRLIWPLPLSLWGLVAYMVYLWVAFGEPLAFVKTQANWRIHHPSSMAEKVIALATLKPLWSCLDPSSPGYWLRRSLYPNPFASLSLVNPLFFVSTIILLGIGFRRRWLSSYELLLASGLLLIPYITTSYEMHMASMGRFVAAIFPLHLVLGQILYRLRGPLAASFLSFSACFLALYAALFAAWYQFY